VAAEGGGARRGASAGAQLAGQSALGVVGGGDGFGWRPALVRRLCGSRSLEARECSARTGRLPLQTMG
jgi:hypothetical protein